MRFDFSGNVQVYIHLGNTSDETIQKLRDLGATVEVTNSDRNVVQAWAPITALDDIAALDVVQEITSPDYAETKAGSVITVGDGIHRADLVRTFSGVTDRGVKVGVISDGVDARRTAQASGDLPSSIEIDPHRSGSGDEGTALLEIVHDLQQRRAGIFRPRYIPGNGRIHPLAGQRRLQWRGRRRHRGRLRLLP